MDGVYRVASQVLRYSIVLALSKGLTFVSSYVVAWNVSDTAFGYFSLVQVGFVTAMTVFGFNSQSAYERNFYGAGIQAVALALRRTYLYVTAAAFVVGLGVLMLWWNHPVYRWFAFLPLCGVLGGLGVVFGTIGRCANDIRGYAIAELSRPVVVFCAVLMFVITRSSIPIGVIYVLALLAGLSLTVVWSAERLWYRLRQPPTECLSEREVIRYIAPLVAVQAMAVINNVGDRYILTGFVSIAEIGRYGKAYLVGSSIGMVADSVAMLWGPLVVKRRVEFEKRFWRWTVIVFWSAIFGSLALLLVSGAIFAIGRTVAGVHSSLVALATIVVAAFVARVGYQVYVPVLNAFDRTGVVARVSLAGTVAGLIVNFALIPVVGIVGAAVATWVAFVCFSLLSFQAVRHLRSEMLVDSAPR